MSEVLIRFRARIYRLTLNERISAQFLLIFTVFRKLKCFSKFVLTGFCYPLLGEMSELLRLGREFIVEFKINDFCVSFWSCRLFSEKFIL